MQKIKAKKLKPGLVAFYDFWPGNGVGLFSKEKIREKMSKEKMKKRISGEAYDISKQTTYIAHTHTHPFNGLFSRTTQVSRYQKGNTNLDFCEARDSEWQWHQLGRMHVCTSLQTDNHASTPPLSFLQAGCPSCRPTNSVKAVKVLNTS